MSPENFDRVRIEKIVTEREGMIAENKQREAEGNSPAYIEKDFHYLIQALDSFVW